ncbi:unnamed protein product [Fraxinus pennsylvanica]|uniref:Uncharacterized protein n=1 Tax=Fraxinus pennsylvanica TaxID=56036 RepID=A0AAD2AJK4_9LAMI|nr:unnamed protein product [Fraxinus pennsylvanica]
MATSLAAMMECRAATFARLSSPGSTARFTYLALHRGLTSAADHNGPTKVDCWKDPMGPSKWKEEHFVIVSLSGWGLLILGGYKFFTGGKKNNEEKLVEATH